MDIKEISEITPNIVRALHKLISQLSSSAFLPSENDLKQIVDDHKNTLFVAEKDGKILGCLTLIVFRIPTGVRAWIEDVVVDKNERGKGIGKELCHTAIEKARKLGARTVDLTSRPDREAANCLYQKLGFTKRETNVYRYLVK
ncbi:MAG: GNAT family N-acetyltransferase [Patescibacteria group bacterium]|jgi:ribosomal protein S18 acetylase RimI-like enzyme